MALMTKAQYYESLEDLHPTTYILGQKIENTYEHPLIKHMLAGVAQTYDLAQDPEGKKYLVAESNAAQVSGRKRFDNEIDCPGKSPEYVLSLWCVQVKGNTPFTGTESEPEKAPFGIGYGIKKGGNPSGRISPRFFHLNYISPEVSQNLTAKNAFFIGQIQDSIRAQHFRILIPASLCSDLLLSFPRPEQSQEAADVPYRQQGQSAILSPVP